MAGVLRVVGIVTTLAAAAYLFEALRLPRGTVDRPGAGIYPILLGLLWLGVGLAFLIRPPSDPEEAPPDWPTGPDLVRVASVGLATMAYIVLLVPLGYVASGALLTLATLWVLGLRAWRRVVVLSAAVAFGSYALFDLVLGVPLPPGAWLP